MVATLPPTNGAVNPAAVRDYLLAMKAGQKPDIRPDIGPQWSSLVDIVERQYLKSGGNVEVMERIFVDQGKMNPALMELLTPLSTLARAEDDEGGFPELPKSAYLPSQLARGASPWLDDFYIPFSKKWSPRGYEGYHECVGISLLSAVAGHRVSYAYGQMEYTPLYIAMVGFTTLFKKTTTARLYYGLLHAAGLDWMLGANITTPQKLLSDMAGKTIPGNYDDLQEEEQARVKKRLAMCGQRGWYYDEFGLHLDQMVKESGVMGDFKGLLRLLDDCVPVFENATQSRGLERIENPYVSLLASMTPADIRPHAQKDSKFWKDGLFARFSFVCPPKGAKSSRERFPDGKIVYPDELVRPLRRWHEWLGTPEIDIEAITNKSGGVTGHRIVPVKPLVERECTATEEVKTAINTYEDALLDIVEQERIPDSMHGSYGRMHKVALRIAMLLASFENRGHIELRHWARAQQFAEARRRDLHELYSQVNSPEQVRTLEEDVLDYLTSMPGRKVVASEIRQFGPAKLRKTPSAALNKSLEVLEKAGSLDKERIEGKTACRYFVPIPLQG